MAAAETRKPLAELCAGDTVLTENAHPTWEYIERIDPLSDCADDASRRRLAVVQQVNGKRRGQRFSVYLFESRDPAGYRVQVGVPEPAPLPDPAPLHRPADPFAGVPNNDDDWS